jgi:uncharacterized protein
MQKFLLFMNQRPTIKFTFKQFIALISLSLLSLHLAFAAEPIIPQYALSGTEVIATPTSRFARQYEVYVSLPRDYASSTKRYPVLYVTDAPYAFPLIRAITNRVQDHGVGLQGFILVGLSYAMGENSRDSRNRDYTLDVPPTTTMPNGDGSSKGHGKVNDYFLFLAEDVIPLIEKRYRVDSTKRVYAGHSYGSLLGLHILFQRPQLFSHYILGSPSLWYGNHIAFARENEFAAKSTALPAKVRFFIGGYEAAKPGKPRYYNKRDMVGDLNRFVAQIRRHKYKGLDVESTILEDEDHATVFPALITRGLMWAFPVERSTVSK